MVAPILHIWFMELIVAFGLESCSIPGYPLSIQVGRSGFHFLYFALGLCGLIQIVEHHPAQIG